MNVVRVRLAGMIVMGAFQGGGCHKKTAPPTPTKVEIAPEISKVPASAGSAAAIPTVGFSTIVVAGDSGVTELRFDGTLIKQWSRTAGKQPRFDREHRRLFFLSANNHEVRELNFADGKERVLATLPNSFKLCAAAPDYPQGEVFSLDRLAVQADEDFVIASNDTAACLSLKDRNSNMLNVDVNVHIDLVSGQVHTTMVTPQCEGSQPVARCALAPLVPAAPIATAVWQYDIENSNIVKRNGTNKEVTHRLGIDNFSVDLAGPSATARWYPLRGNVSQGDYIHSSLLLLDRSNGSVWPIKAGPTAPLSNQEILAIDNVTTVDVVGESTIRWLTSPAKSGTGIDQPALTEVLIVDHLLVRPGQPAIELNGDVAR